MFAVLLASSRQQGHAVNKFLLKKGFDLVTCFTELPFPLLYHTSAKYVHVAFCFSDWVLLMNPRPSCPTWNLESHLKAWRRCRDNTCKSNTFRISSALPNHALFLYRRRCVSIHAPSISVSSLCARSLGQDSVGLSKSSTERGLHAMQVAPPRLA